MEVRYASPERIKISIMVMTEIYRAYSASIMVSPKRKSPSMTRKRNAKTKKRLRKRKFIKKNGNRYSLRVSYILSISKNNAHKNGLTTTRFYELSKKPALQI